MNTTGRVTAGLFAIVVLGGIVQLSQLERIKRLQQDIEALGAVDLEMARRAVEIRRLVSEVDEYRRKYAVLRDPGYAIRLAELEDGVARELSGLREIELPEEGLEALTELESSWDEGIETGGSGEGFVGALRAHLETLETLSRATTRDRIVASQERARRARRDSVFWAIASVALSALLAVVIGRSVGEPIGRLEEAMRRVTSGDLTTRAEPRGAPEIAALTADFNVMVERLSEVDRMKQQFVSGVSHDLKAPLASMRETLDLLLEGSVGDINEVQQELLDATVECNERLNRMIVDLLDLARLEDSVAAFKLSPEDLNELVSEAVSEASALAPVDRRQLVMASTRDAVPVEADRPLILQLLRNLITNAVRHSAPGSAVAVESGIVDCAQSFAEHFTTRPAGLSLPIAYVSVKDHGPGVAPGEEELIFERFYRSTGGGRRGEGSGLGLAIAREIVNGHGGQIWVESTSSGGSLFVATLPLRVASPSSSTPTAHETSNGE